MENEHTEISEETESKLAEFKKDLQVWYNRDKGENIIEDLSELID